MAAAMGVSQLSARTSIDWLAGQPLQYFPGGSPSASCDIDPYFNEGYMILGEIIRQRSGRSLESYLRQRVLTPDMWVPATDIRHGHIFAADTCAPEYDPREPGYDSDGHTSENVRAKPLRFPGSCDILCMVPACSGSEYATAYCYVDFEATGWATGGLVASPATMLELASRYHIERISPDVGQPISAAFPLEANEDKGGRLTGTNTFLVQRNDDDGQVNVFIFFNKNPPDGGQYASDFYYERLEPTLDAMNDPSAAPPFTWPTLDIGGFWVDPDRTSPGVLGSYNYPFGDLDEALAYLADGSRVNFKVPLGETATSRWTGTISTKLELKAPLGTVVIGG